MSVVGGDMARYIEGQDRQQVTLMPECLDDFVAGDNPVRVVDAFVDELDLVELGFERAAPAATGRPSYHPAALLKLYIYGYLNRIQSSRRLERECQRNVELMWLTGRLAPDFKTIADFRRDNGTGIRNVCRRFVVVCRELKLLSPALVAIDGSKFKAVNARDKNFTTGKIDKRQQQIEESIHRYLVALDTADRTQPPEFEAKSNRLQDKIERLRKQMRALDEVNERLRDEPDGQRSMTDPDARSMATSGRGSGIVGYNVQVAVDAKHHLIVAHQVLNQGRDRAALALMGTAAREAMGAEQLSAIADRGYYNAQQIKACDESGVAAILPKPTTSNAKAEGRFGGRTSPKSPRPTSTSARQDSVRSTGPRAKRPAYVCGAIGAVHVLNAPSRASARPATIGTSGAGSMKTSWRRPSSDWIGCPRP